MRTLDIPFDGSDRLFRTQQSLVNVAGHAVWLPHFTPTSLDHLQFVHHLLQTICELDICCTITGTYPAYIAGVLTSYYNTSPVIRRLHIARTHSSILEDIYRKSDIFAIGPFHFHLTDREEYETLPDYSKHAITFENVTVCFIIAIADISTSCASKSSINCTEFIWYYLCEFGFKMYAIVCVPIDTPTLLHLFQHRVVSDGWNSASLCLECSVDLRRTLQPFVGPSNGERSCGCNICLRQPLSLRNLASHTVFHLTFNLTSFTLTDKKLYHQYVYAVESNVVPDDRLVPLSFSHLICSFVRDKRHIFSKRFHDSCVIPSERYWSTAYIELHATIGEAITKLRQEKENLRCDFCARQLFKTRSCLIN